MFAGVAAVHGAAFLCCPSDVMLLRVRTNYGFICLLPSESHQLLGAAIEIAGDYVWGVYDLLILPPSFPYGAAFSLFGV